MKKVKLIVVTLALIAALVLAITGCYVNGDDNGGKYPAAYAVTIAPRPRGVLSFSVINAGQEVVSGAQIVAGEQLTITWTTQGGYAAVLHINGQLASATSPHVATVTEAMHIEVVVTQRPYVLIQSAQDFAKIGENLDGTFKLAANLTLDNWTPVGTFAEPFTGVFFTSLDVSGNPEFVITRLSINSVVREEIAPATGRYTAGLFGVSSGEIENIVIKELNINITVNTVTTADRTLAGGIVGENSGTIRGSRVVDGTVAVHNAQGGTRAGMIAGRVIGTIGGEPAFVLNSIAESGEIFIFGAGGSGSRAGGLVGQLEGGGRIYRSAAHVNVEASSSGTQNIQAGGLVGHITRGGSIFESIATGTAFSETTGGATIYAGGLTGNIDHEDELAPSGLASDFRWTVEIINNIAAGNAIGRSVGPVGNVYVSALLARIDDSGATASNTTVRGNFTTGDAVIEREGTLTSQNLYVAGIVSRIQTHTDSTVSIVDNFVTGNVAIMHEGVEFLGNLGGNAFAGRIVARHQNNGQRAIENNFAYEGMTVAGFITTHAAQREDLTLTSVTDTSMTNLKSAAWQRQTLNWSETTWRFTDGYFPQLVWATV